MKRSVACLVLLAALLLPLAGCKGEQGVQQRIFEELGVDVGQGTVQELTDTHGGFFGDGTEFVALSFEGGEFLQQLAGSPGWQPLPLPEDMQALAYGVSSGTFSMGPYVTGEDGDPRLLPINQTKITIAQHHY